MSKQIVVFVGFLILATYSLGQSWHRIAAWAADPVDATGSFAAIIFPSLAVASLLVLRRLFIGSSSPPPLADPEN